MSHFSQMSISASLKAHGDSEVPNLLKSSDPEEPRSNLDQKKKKRLFPFYKVGSPGTVALVGFCNYVNASDSIRQHEMV